MIDVDALAIFRLAEGAHERPEDGLCAMEAIAWLEGEAHTDHPACTCPVIAAYVRNLNDRLDDAERQRLVVFLPRLVGTVSPRHEKSRAKVAVWKALHVFAPVALELRGLGTLADRLRASRTFREGRRLARTAAAADPLAAAAVHTANAVAWCTDSDHASAADAVVYAASAAAVDARQRAAVAARTRIIDAAFAGLDDMLAIGPAGTFSRDVTPAIECYRTLVLAL